MRRFLAVGSAIVIGVVFYCCGVTDKISHDEVIGSWKSDIQFDHFKGKEYMVLAADNRVSVTDSLKFEMANDPFCVKLGCCLSYRGEWTLADDSLMVNFSMDSIYCGVNKESFEMVVNPAHTDDNESIDIRTDFFDELSSEITEELKSNVERLCGHWVVLGKVCFTSVDSMAITNNGNVSVYIRNATLANFPL